MGTAWTVPATSRSGEPFARLQNGFLPPATGLYQGRVRTSAQSQGLAAARTQMPVQMRVSAGGRSAVVVTGDSAMRRAVTAELEGLRWQVRQASGAAEMVMLLDQQQSAVAIVDSWLPDLDVRECVEELRVNFPELDIMTLDGTDVGAVPAHGLYRGEVFHGIRQAQERLSCADLAVNVKVQPETDAMPAPSIENADAPAWTGSLSEREILRRHAAPSTSAPTPTTSQFAFQAEEEAGKTGFHKTVAGESLGTSLEALNPRLLHDRPLPEFVGTDPRLLEVSRRIGLVAHRKTTVLVHGPTGTGKELVARAIHRLSGRSGCFIAINCAAIPEALVEAELFGHARGAFTGAQGSRVGKIEAAAGGTLFLDEIGELPFAVQSKLLRFLESGEVQRIGENEPTYVDVRVVAATHRKLGAMAAEGSFRLDLLHRLSVFLIHTPALAGRKDDIDALISHSLAQLAASELPKQLSAAAREKLFAYNWPGNVRELVHTLERAWILSGESALIDECCIDFGESLF